ncbi:MAG TPA: hypothetical protein QGI72_01315 [Poseidonia sp.]|nr:hypothetical protein [Poseidonia sp.]
MRADTSIVLSLLILGAFLSLSPLILFGDSEQLNTVTRDDLSVEQISSLNNGTFAKSLKDNDAIIITSAIIVKDSLFIAGEFSGEITIGNQSYLSQGSSDLIMARLAPNGTWIWVEVLGGAGNDRDVTFEYKNEQLFVKGSIFGEINTTSGYTVGSGEKNGHERIIGEISVENGTWKLLTVDPFGDLSANPSLWCGWR